MNKVLTSILAVLCTGWLIAGCCPKNPQLNSAIATHGNTDWHIDTANEFLYGTDMDGNLTASSHCPDAWSRRHVHVDMTHTNDFYHDKDQTPTGADTDPDNGIDQAMLFFYAGHGHPEFWNTLGNNATQDNMRLGDCQNDDKGVLRYYWQCSCKVFAHGPRVCPGAGMDYACPEDFDGSGDSSTMRNVYQRWGDALSPNLRMACGVSTNALCHESEANRIWNGYLNDGLGVADAFIEGLSVSEIVPLCITLGGADVNATPLVADETFTNQPNRSGSSHYHIQYLSSFESTPVPFRIEILPDMYLPVYRLIPLPIPPELLDIKLAEEGRWLSGTDARRKLPVKVRINKASGAIYLKGQTGAVNKARLTESDYLAMAQRHMKAFGLSEDQVLDPQGAKMMIDTTPVKAGAGEIEKHQKSATVRYRRFIAYGGHQVKVLGDGGIITVRMNNDGSLLGATKVWRQMADVKTRAPIKPYKQALAEAMEQLNEKERYDLHDWDWGYKALDGNSEQQLLQVVYQFVFTPQKEEDLVAFPPRRIEIKAQKI